MFHFIEPKEHYLYKEDIFAFLEGVSPCPKLYEAFENWEKASFLLAQDVINNGKYSGYRSHDHNQRPKSVKGGALLLKQATDLLHPRIQEHLETF